MSRKKLNLIGKVFGDLIIIEEVEKPDHLKRNGFYWLAKCKCGNTVIGTTDSFTKGERTHCGCKSIENLSKSHIGNGVIDMIGKRFGRLTVLKQEGVSKNNKLKYRCKCDCQNEIIALGASLRRKERPTRSCGCIRKENHIKYCSKFNHYRWNPNLDDSLRYKRTGCYTGALERKWRLQVYKRDEFKCSICIKNNKNLRAHHLNNFRDFIEQRYDINNGITLCEDCHKDFHKMYGNIGSTAKQFYSYLDYRKNLKCLL